MISNTTNSVPSGARRSRCQRRRRALTDLSLASHQRRSLHQQRSHADSQTPSLKRRLPTDDQRPQRLVAGGRSSRLAPRSSLLHHRHRCPPCLRLNRAQVSLLGRHHADRGGASTSRATCSDAECLVRRTATARAADCTLWGTNCALRVFAGKALRANVRSVRSATRCAARMPSESTSPPTSHPSRNECVIRLTADQPCHSVSKVRGARRRRGGRGCIRATGSGAAVAVAAGSRQRTTSWGVPCLSAPFTHPAHSLSAFTESIS